MTQLSSIPRRVTVVAPHTRADVALPLEATVAEVVQQLSRLVEVEAQDPTGSSGGWLLSRLGREPFDDEQVVAASGIRDGDLLYLTSRRSRLPAVVFDDVVDAIAGAAEARGDRWTPAGTRRAALAAALAAATAGLAALGTTGAPWQLPAVVAAAVALLLLGCAASVARALDEPALGAAVAAAATAYAGLAGLLGVLQARSVLEAGAPQLLLACVAVLSCCVLGMLAVGRVLAPFVGACLAATVVGAAAAWAAFGPERPDRVAAVTAAVVLLGQPLLPVAALRLARVPAPRLPSSPTEFRRTRPVPLDDSVLEQTRRAEQALTALVVVTHLVLLAAVARLLLTPQTWPHLLGVVLSLVVLVRARHTEVRSQRVALLAAAAAGLGLAVATVLPADAPARAACAVAAVGVAAGCVAYGRKAPGRSPSPYWGRALDVVEFLAVGAVVPLVVAVFDLYATIRGVAG